MKSKTADLPVIIGGKKLGNPDKLLQEYRSFSWNLRDADGNWVFGDTPVREFLKLKGITPNKEHIEAFNRFFDVASFNKIIKLRKEAQRDAARKEREILRSEGRVTIGGRTFWRVELRLVFFGYDNRLSRKQGPKTTLTQRMSIFLKEQGIEPTERNLNALTKVTFGHLWEQISGKKSPPKKQPKKPKEKRRLRVIR